MISEKEIFQSKLWIEAIPAIDDKGKHAAIISYSQRGSMVDVKFQRGDKIYKCNIKKEHFGLVKYRCQSQPEHAWAMLNGYCINLYEIPTKHPWMETGKEIQWMERISAEVFAPEGGYFEVRIHKKKRQNKDEDWEEYQVYSYTNIDRAYYGEYSRLANKKPGKLWNKVKMTRNVKVNKIIDFQEEKEKREARLKVI